MADLPENNLIRRLTFAYLGALSLIAILSGSVHLILDGIIARQTDSAAIINVAGRQRMLSQRTAFLATQFQDHGGEETREALLAAVALMERSHHALTRGDTDMGIVNELSPAAQRHYFAAPVSLDNQVAAFIASARHLAQPDLSPSDSAQTLATIQQAALLPLLRDLDGAVKLFEMEANDRVSNLRTVQRSVLAILLATLMLEAAFIFRPLVQKVREFAFRLFHLAMHDSLTGAFNRRAFLEAADREIARARRTGQPMVLLALDVDHFKRINDTLGHAAGDTVLRNLAARIEARIRGTDILARTGGEEFVVMLPDTDRVAGQQVAESLRALLAATPLLPNGPVITGSFGVADLADADTGIADLLRRADEALYQAKHGGRNQVVVAQDPPPVHDGMANPLPA